MPVLRPAEKQLLDSSFRFYTFLNCLHADLNFKLMSNKLSIENIGFVLILQLLKFFDFNILI